MSGIESSGVSYLGTARTARRGKAGAGAELEERSIPDVIANGDQVRGIALHRDVLSPYTFADVRVVMREVERLRCSSRLWSGKLRCRPLSLSLRYTLSCRYRLRFESPVLSIPAISLCPTTKRPPTYFVGPSPFPTVPKNAVRKTDHTMFFFVCNPAEPVALSFTFWADVPEALRSPPLAVSP